MTNPNFGTVSLSALQVGGWPTALASGASWTSPILQAGFGAVVAATTIGQAGSVSIQRFADSAGTVLIGAAETTVLVASTAGWTAIDDGVPYLYYQVTITNTSGSPATVANSAILTGPR